MKTKIWIVCASLLMTATTVQAASTETFYGWRSDSFFGKNVACDQSLFYVQCNYAPNKTVWFRVTGDGMTAEYKTWVEQHVDSYNNSWVTQLSGWALGRTNGDNWDMRIDFGPAGAGDDPSYINAYTTITCLTPGATYTNESSVVGSHRRCSQMQLTIDWAKIQSVFTGPGQAANVLRHALAGGMLHGIGIGWQTGFDNRWSSLRTTPNQEKQSALWSREVCRANAWSQSGSSIGVIKPSGC